MSVDAVVSYRPLRPDRLTDWQEVSRKRYRWRWWARLMTPVYMTPLTTPYERVLVWSRLEDVIEDAA